MVDTQQLLNALVPLLQIVIYGLAGVVLLGGTYYYLYHVLGKRKWYLRIYELTESGRLRLRCFDQLIEKKVMYGKRIIYWLKNAKCTTIPPSSNIVQNVGKRDYVDYIKLDTGVYAPMPSDVLPFPEEKDGKPKKWLQKFAERYFKQKKDIEKLNPKDVHERYIYIPLNRGIKLNLKYDVRYDVDMMRMNAIDLRDLMWQGTVKFWEKYGTLIVAGLMLIVIIAIAVLSYEHMQKMASIQLTECAKAMQQGISDAITKNPAPFQ